jgi:predicted O-methyltransferase YrrM
MKSYTINFLLYMAGLRPAATTDTDSELTLLAAYASRASIIVEVGVFEGVGARVMAEASRPGARLYLVDPYFKSVHAERIFRISFAEQVARRELLPWKDRVNWVKKTSALAATEILEGPESSGLSPDFVFIDAAHDYESVKRDFSHWGQILAVGGSMAFHDSRLCPARPDLTLDTGPVRLMAELAADTSSKWEISGSADSITVITRKSDAI